MNEKVMTCPHGWNECNFCANLQKCIAGMYEPDENEHRQTLREAAAVAEDVMDKKVQISAEKIIKRNGSVALVESDSETFWDWWGKSSPIDPQNISREPIAAMSGAIEYGGGSKSGKKRKKPKRKSDFSYLYLNY